jgi:hypothetical protein
MPAELLKATFPFFQPGAVPLPPVMLTTHTTSSLMRPYRSSLVAATDIRITRQARKRAHPYYSANAIAGELTNSICMAIGADRYS